MRFIYTCTNNAISRVSRKTIAVKGSFSVSAVGISVTDVGVAVVIGSEGFFVAFRYVFERKKVNTEESYVG